MSALNSTLESTRGRVQTANEQIDVVERRVDEVKVKADALKQNATFIKSLDPSGTLTLQSPILLTFIRELFMYERTPLPECTCTAYKMLSALIGLHAHLVTRSKVRRLTCICFEYEYF